MWINLDTSDDLVDWAEVWALHDEIDEWIIMNLSDIQLNMANPHGRIYIADELLVTMFRLRFGGQLS